MKVGIKDKADKVTVSEMHGTGDEVGSIAEMLTDPAKIESFIPVRGLGAKALAISESLKDTDPEYPIVRVEEGWSRSKRLYSADFLSSVAEQINTLEPVGHLGHIPDDQRSTAFPDVQTTWLGAVTKQEPSQLPERKGQTVAVLYAAGYNHPGSKIRGYIKAHAVRGVSWDGIGSQVPVPGKGVEIKAFVLKSLDWARKLHEGMPSSSIVAVTSEMEEKVDKELSQVTPEEFKRENPNGYALLVREAQDEQKETISEMESKVSEGEDAKSLLTKACEAIGITDPSKLVDELTSLKEKVGVKASAMVKSALDALLEERIPDENRRQLARRLLPVSEMEAKSADAKDEDAVTKIVTEMVDKSFNDDEVIQGIVSEMAPPVVRRREELNGKAGQNAPNPYIETRERVTLGG